VVAIPADNGGLTTAEATRRLKDEGPNALPRRGSRGFLRIALEVVREPMFALLLGAGAVYLVLGDRLEAIVLFAFASVSVLIAIVQESRSEHVLEALRDVASPRALVIRDGTMQRIAGCDVVRGDTLILGEGDRVPADALLTEAIDLIVDESALTGESVPVRKRAAADDMSAAVPGGEDRPHVFSGTLAVRGQGRAVVTATGPRSEIGRIGEALVGIETVAPRLTVETRRLVRTVALVGLTVSVAAVVLYGLLRGSWLHALLAGIALEMSMLPEEFPLVLTVFMVMGAWRISQARVLTRRASAIETLGAATVLCTDKTGTLTENRMSIAALTVAEETLRADALASPAPAFAELLRFGVLASAPDAIDPMERAFHDLAGKAGLTRQTGLTLAHGWGIAPGLLAVTQVWTAPDGEITVAVKGAVEAVAELCRLDESARTELRAAADGMAGDGMRVLAVAQATCEPNQPLPDTPRDFAFTLLGLVGLVDPLRASVPDAVRDCRSAGIRVVMITGDYPATAQAIARAAGIDAEHVMTGPELEALDDAQLALRIGEVSVFARILPTQKLRIVEALKAAGAVVAMTGDGINDAPSLKAADIGIAMGKRGTDVAREASSIVLLDDDFGSIVRTIRLGRRIYDNLRKAMAYILAVHVPIGGLALLPLMLGLPIIFTPLNIAFLEMVIDPVCSIVFEAEDEEDDVMRRPPRNPKARLFSRGMIASSLFQGALAFAFVAVTYLIALGRGMPETEVRALTFVTLVLANFALVFANRAFGASLLGAFRRHNTALRGVMAVCAVMLGIVLFLPAARDLFHFGPLHADDLAVTAAVALVLLVALEQEKHLWKKRRRHPHPSR
jgi:Ca2+-transporting ATPase